MRFSFLPSLLGILILNACAPQPRPVWKPYTGLNSSEAILTFDAAVEIQANTLPHEIIAKGLIEDQLKHMFGPMSAAKRSAAPKENHRITNLRVSKTGTPNLYSASYHYSGTIAIEDASSLTYTFPLPRNPKNIYRDSAVKAVNRTVYPCTDSHYNSEGDFWYFWNPDQLGCRLKEGIHFDRISGQLKVIPSTKRTFPEYERLINEDGQITVTVFFGMDNPELGRNPLNSTDANASNVRNARKILIQDGFTARALTQAEQAELLGFTSKPVDYVEEFTKPGPEATLVVRLFFGPTGIDENSRTFHSLFKRSLKTDSVMIYDGHSGLGGNLDLDGIESLRDFEISFDQTRYQIYFFNSCSSYTYYNEQYFSKKGGTQNLDILTNGLSTAFNVMHDTNLALIHAIDAFAQGKPATSYQELAAAIDSENLFGVNGDEDNPTR